MKNQKKQKTISQEEVVELIIEKRFKHHIFLPQSVNKGRKKEKRGHSSMVE